MLKIFIIIAGIIFSASTFAQAEKFAGTSVGVNAGYNVETYTKSSVTTTAGQNNTASNINATYTFALSPEWTIGTGLTYALSSTTLATAAATGNNEYSMNSHYSLNIEPGYVLNENTLGYFKLSYNSGVVKNTYYSIDQTITGIGYGLGTKFFISKNAFLNIEMQQTKYNSYTYVTTVLTHTTTEATVGIGYKF